MTPLHLHVRADLLQDALDSALDGADDGGQVVLGDRHLLLPALIEEAWALDPSRGRVARLGPLGEHLLVDAVAAEAQGPLLGMAGTPGLRRALGRVFHAAGLAGLSPQVFDRLARRLGGPPAPAGQAGDVVPARVLEVARLHGRYRALLPARLADEAGVFRRGVVALGKSPPQALLRADSLIVHGLSLLPEGPALPTLHGCLLGLAALSTGEPEPWIKKSASRLPVRLLLPETAGKPLLEAAITPLLESLYRYDELDLEEVRVPLVSPGELPPSRLLLRAAPGPGAEARDVAREVRDLIDFGVAPAGICVGAQDPARRARITAALRRYGVPVHQPQPLDQPHRDRRHVVGLAPPIQVLLAMYEVLEDGVPREGLIQLLSTRYLRFFRGAAGPWVVSRALREAGVREFGAALPGGEPDHGRRLAEWLRQQGDKVTLAHRAVPGMIDSALGVLAGLPQQAPLPVHVAALLRACDRLQLCELSRGLFDTPAASLDDSSALSRDQEAVAVLLDVLHELPLIVQRLPVLKEPLSRDRFSRLLGDVLMHTLLRPRGVEGAAVVVGDLLSLSGRRFQHLFLCGLVEGELPGHCPDDPVLSDDERHGLNRLLGRDVFPLSRHADVRTPLVLYQALSLSQTAHLSWPLTDDEGRPLLRSSFVDEVLRATARPEPPRGEHAVVPEKDHARCAAELWTRAVLDRQGGTAHAGARRREGAALFSALSRQDPQRAQRLLAMIDIEHSRQEWFAARLAADATPGTTQDLTAGAPPLRFGRFIGRLVDETLRRDLSLRLPGSPEHALSASALEDYAKCPFRFFLRRVLKAVPVQEGGDDLDPLAGGRLHHAVLERFFKERHEAGRLPLRGDPEESAALDQAIERVLSTWPETERTGHKDLFAVRIRRLREDLCRMIEREAQKPLLEGCVPRLFEHEFGPLAITSASDPDGGLPLSIKGIIDRVDIGGGRALVLDYKSGRLERYESILRHDLLDTSFQLPLYAAALRFDPKLPRMGISVEEVTARYYSLRNGRATQGELSDQQMISLSPDVQAQAPEHNVAEVAYRLWRRLRDGDFRVDPRTCEGCGLEAACRVSLCGAPYEPAAAPPLAEGAGGEVS